MKTALSTLLLLCVIGACQKNKSKQHVLTPNKLSTTYYTLVPKAQINYLDSLFLHYDTKALDRSHLDLLFAVAAEYYYHKKYQKSLVLSKKIFQFTEESTASINMGRALYYMGDCYLETKKDSAFYYYSEAEKIFALLHNTDRLAKVQYNKAYLLYYEGNYIESEIEVIKALNYLRKSTNHELAYMCYSIQGSNHLELEEYDKALEYFNLATTSLNYAKNTSGSIADYFIINQIDKCNIYDKKGNYKKSIEELSKLNTLSLKNQNPELYSSVLGNLAYSYMKNGNYKSSKKYFLQALQLTKKNKYSHQYLYKALNYGEFLVHTKDTIAAKNYFLEALKIGKKLKSGKEVLKTLRFLIQTDKRNRNFYDAEYIKINDSINKKQRITRDKFARIAYETTKVEDENKTLSRKLLLLLLGTTISIICLLVVTLLYYRKTKKKEIKLIKERNDATEELFEIIKSFQEKIAKAKSEEQQRISQELHDNVMNQIYGIRLSLGLLNKSEESQFIEKRLSLIKKLQHTESEIRTLSHNLKSNTTFNTTDFNFLIKALILTNNEFSKTTFNSKISKKIDWSTYNSIIKINLYRIIQEAFLNVNKHANAKFCMLTIKEKTNQLLVTISDNGKGFDTKSMYTGIGITNMNDRAQSIGATFAISGIPNKNTTIKICIPKTSLSVL